MRPANINTMRDPRRHPPASSTVTGQVETIARVPIRSSKRPTSTDTNTKQDNRKHKLSSRTNDYRAALYQRTENECAPFSPSRSSSFSFHILPRIHAYIHLLLHPLFLSLSHTYRLYLSLPPTLSIRSLSCGRSLMVDVVKRFGVAWEF